MSATWPTVALGEVLRQDTQYVHALEPRQYPKLSVRLYGRGVVLDSSADGGTVKMQKHQFARPGQVILSEIWAKKGAIGIVPPEGNGALCTSHFFLFDIDEAKAMTEFIAWLLRGNYFEPQLNAEARGTTGYAAIRPKQFLATSIPLPSLDEQRRIVARIEELAAKVEEAKGLSQKSAEEVFTLFGKRIAEIFSAKAASAWTPGTLGDYVIDDCYGTSEKTNDDASGTPILRMGNIQSGRLINTSLKYLHIAPKEREKLILKSGDILVNRTNSAELVGKCAVFDLSGEYGFASYIIRLRLDQTKADPRLVAAFINSPTGRAYMFSEKKQMTGQANVNATTLKKLPISLPDLCSQKCIVSELDFLQAKLDTVKSFQKETAAELGAMLPAILDKAFKGAL